MLSVSELKMFRLCEKAWELKYLKKVRPPPSQALARGIEVHKKFEEDFHKPDATMPAILAVRSLVDCSQVKLEKSFESEVSPGVVWKGRMDVSWPGGVADLKTCKSFRYAMSRASLERDPQAVVYGLVASRPGDGEVALHWIYQEVKPDNIGGVILEGVKTVSVHVRRSVLLERYNDEILPDAKALLKARAREVKPSWPSTPSACGQFGGCPYHVSMEGPCEPPHPLSWYLSTKPSKSGR